MSGRIRELAARLQENVLKQAPDALLLELHGRRVVVREEDGRLVLRTLFYEAELSPDIDRAIETLSDELMMWRVDVKEWYAEVAYKVLRERFGEERVKIERIPPFGVRFFRIVVQAPGRLGGVVYDRIIFEGSDVGFPLVEAFLQVRTEGTPQEIQVLNAHAHLLFKLFSVFSNSRGSGTYIELVDTDVLEVDGQYWIHIRARTVWAKDAWNGAFRNFLSSLLGTRNIINVLYDKLESVKNSAPQPIPLAVYLSLRDMYRFLARQTVTAGESRIHLSPNALDMIHLLGATVFGANVYNELGHEVLEHVSLLDPRLEDVSARVVEAVYPLVALSPGNNIRRPSEVVRVLSELTILTLALRKITLTENFSRLELFRALEAIGRFYQDYDRIVVSVLHTSNPSRLFAKLRGLEDPRLLRTVIQLSRDMGRLFEVPDVTLARAVWLGIISARDLKWDTSYTPKALEVLASTANPPSATLTLRVDKRMLNTVSARFLLSLPPTVGAWVENDIITVLTRSGVAARVLPLQELRDGFLALVMPEGVEHGVIAIVSGARDIENAVFSALSGKPTHTLVVQLVERGESVEWELRVKLAERVLVAVDAHA